MRSRTRVFFLCGAVAALAVALASCGNTGKVQANNPGGPGEAAAPGGSGSEISVGVVKIGRKALGRTLTLSSELVPFQEIDIYAKESGYVKQINVDYGSRVQANQVIATLEIPELQSQLKQDDAAIKAASDQITYAQNLVSRAEAQHNVLQLQYGRLAGVAKSKPGLVAQQEVDDSQGKALASESQVDAAKSNLQSAQSQLAVAEAKREHDQVLYDYSKITAPFAGIITQRFANLGTLLQAGTNSSTQAMPLVRLSEDDLFRLVIPVPESYVHSIHVGDPVNVVIPSLNNRAFPGKVARFSVDVQEDTRTMHTEVDVQNPGHVLLPGLYAEATLTLDQKANALAIPIQAVNQGDQNTVYMVTPANKIEVRPVTLGIQTDKDAEVLSGLHEGDLIVVGDRSALKAGQEVQPKVIELVQGQSQE